MNPFLEKLKKIEIKASLQKGPFDLFALVRDEDLVDRWDVLVAADWTEKDYEGSLKYLSKLAVDNLTSNELVSISNILIRDPYDPMVKDLQKIATVEHGYYEVKNYYFYGFVAETVYLITCKLQYDRTLMRLVWMYLLGQWKKGKKKIESEDILKYVQSGKRKVEDFALDRVLTHLKNSNCINAVEFMGADYIRAHGNMLITKVNPDCKAE